MSNHWSYKKELSFNIKVAVGYIDQVYKNVENRTILSGKGTSKSWSAAEKDMYKKCKTLKKKIKKIDDGANTVNNKVKELKASISKQDWGTEINRWLKAKVNDFGSETASYKNTRQSKPIGLPSSKKIKRLNVKLKDVQDCISLTNAIQQPRLNNRNAYKAAQKYFDGPYKKTCKKWKSKAGWPFNYANDYKLQNDNSHLGASFAIFDKVTYVAGVSALMIHNFMVNAESVLKKYNKKDKSITKKQYKKACTQAATLYSEINALYKKIQNAKTKKEAEGYLKTLKLKQAAFKKKRKTINNYKNASAKKKNEIKSQWSRIKSLMASAKTIVAGKSSGSSSSSGSNNDSKDTKKKSTKKKAKKKTKKTKKASSTKKKLNKLSKQVKKQQKEIKKMKKDAETKAKQVEADKKAAEEAKTQEINQMKEDYQKEMTDLKEDLTKQSEEKLTEVKEEYDKNIDTKNDEISDLKKEVSDLKSDLNEANQRSESSGSSSSGGGSDYSAPEIDDTPSTSTSSDSSSSSSSSGDNSGVSDPTGATLGAPSGSQTDPITGSGSDSGSETDTGDTTSADDVSVIDENAEPTPTKSSSGGGSVIPGVLGVAAAGAAGFAGVRYIKNKNKDKFIVDEYDDSDEDEEDYSYNDKSEASGEKYKAGSDKVNNLSLDEEQDIKIGEDYDEDDDVNEELE